MSNDRQYELVYIAQPDASEEALADLHQQVASVVERFGGRIDRTEAWGRRKLAYEIGRYREGVYVLEVISGPGAMTAEIDRRLHVFDVVIRHMLCRVDDDLARAERAKVRRKTNLAARRVRRGLPPEPTESELAKRGAHADDDDGDSVQDVFGAEGMK